MTALTSAAEATSSLVSHPVMSVRDLDVALGGHPILTGINVDLHAGEVVALVGPNGAGKSTLLSALAGDVTFERGQVAVDGVPLGDVPVAQLARRRAVQVQEARLSFAFTVVEVVRMGRAPWQGTDHDLDDDDVIADALERSEMEGMAHRRFPTLSGGEKARVAFSRALAQETAVMLLDEPTAALDIRHQEAVLREVRSRASAGVAVVVVLHDLTLAGAYADRVVLLDEGRVRADGPPRQVLRADVLSDVYRHAIYVIDDPHSGGLIVVPARTSQASQRSVPSLEPVSGHRAVPDQPEPRLVSKERHA